MDVMPDNLHKLVTSLIVLVRREESNGHQRQKLDPPLSSPNQYLEVVVPTAKNRVDLAGG